jgi:hypothetical protein
MVPRVHPLESLRAGRLQKHIVVFVGAVKRPSQPHLATSAPGLINVEDALRGVPLELNCALADAARERAHAHQPDLLQARVPIENLHLPPRAVAVRRVGAIGHHPHRVLARPPVPDVEHPRRHPGSRHQPLAADQSPKTRHRLSDRGILPISSTVLLQNKCDGRL